ncbi:MAG: ribonuclease J [Pseudomonadota bacterium]
MAKADELVFLPLGGVGEIGMNLALYGFGPAGRREWIIVDCGVAFPGPDLPGVDLVFPEIRYIEDQKIDLKAIVVTHAHEDHYGALADLWPYLRVPVFVTPFTAGLLEAKLTYDRYAEDIPVKIYHAGDSFRIGPFSIEAVPVSHSIPEPVSLIINTPAGRIIHTGDWKIDPAPTLEPLTDEARFQKAGDDGVLALICDSTNALREGVSPSEQAVSDGLAQIISAARGRVAVTTFSSNVGRIRSIAEAAATAGRKVLLLGSSIKRVVDVATDLGIMDGLAPFIDEEEFGYIDRNKIVIILTGSQGESRAALAKLSRGEMRNVSLGAGDTVIFSSRVIPGNEKPILDIKNGLIEQGVDIITDDDALVHVSGHPRRNELKQMYEWVRPDIVVPVHGEAAHLIGQTELAHQCGISSVPRVRNGDLLRLAPGPAEVIEEVAHGRIYKDGDLIGDFDEMGIGERRKLSYVGHIAVNVLLTGKHELFRDPSVRTHGMPEADDEGRLLSDALEEAAIRAVESIPRARRRDISVVQEAVRRAVRSAARDIWGKKPVMTVFVTRV